MEQGGELQKLGFDALHVQRPDDQGHAVGRPLVSLPVLRALAPSFSRAGRAPAAPRSAPRPQVAVSCWSGGRHQPSVLGPGQLAAGRLKVTRRGGGRHSGLHQGLHHGEHHDKPQ